VTLGFFLTPGIKTCFYPASARGAEKMERERNIANQSPPPKGLVVLGLPPVTEADGMGGNDERKTPTSCLPEEPPPTRCCLFHAIEN